MRLLERHCATVRYQMTEAVTSYDEKPRDQWIFDFPAQVALCGTQIWWTTEVNIAFGRLEEGYENALKDYNKKQVLWLLLFQVDLLSTSLLQFLLVLSGLSVPPQVLSEFENRIHVPLRLMLGDVAILHNSK